MEAKRSLISIFSQKAIKTRYQETNKKEHWLDYAETAYSKKFVTEAKTVINLLITFLPLSMFWALIEQQGSRWTLQAINMDDNLGFGKIKPDQVQVVISLFVVTLRSMIKFASRSPAEGRKSIRV